MAQGKLQGQTALVTRACSGIGKAIAIALGKEGANVVIHYNSDHEEAKDTMKQIMDAGAKASLVQANLSREADVRQMYDLVLKEYAAIDILVCNSGIEVEKKLVDMTLDDWNQVVETNLTGYFVCAKEAAREFIKKGVVDGVSTAAGKMVFVNSFYDHLIHNNQVNLSPSKIGLMQFIEATAIEMAASKVRVNSISTGIIKTTHNKHTLDLPGTVEKLVNIIPYNRIGEAEDIGRLAAFLVSDEADYIVGANFCIDGGLSLVANR